MSQDPFDERLYTEGLLSDDDGFVPDDPDHEPHDQEQVQAHIRSIMLELERTGHLPQTEIQYLKLHAPELFKPSDTEGYW